MDMASLPGATQLASALERGAGARHSRWHPRVPLASHSEIFAAADEAGGAGVALAFACQALRQQRSGVAEEKAVLWVQDERSLARSGRPYRPGLPAALRHRLVHVAARSAGDALFALEEGLRCRDLACVIGEIAGNPRALDFTASRRLSLVAQRHGVPLLLVRIEAQPDLSAARMRWRVRSAPSAPPLWDRGAPGTPAWQAELFRARGHAPGQWILRDDRDALFAERASDTNDDHAPTGSPTPGPSIPADHGDLVRAAGA